MERDTVADILARHNVPHVVDAKGTRALAPHPLARAIRPTCRECGRTFNLADETDAAEWAYGHDCES